MLSRGPRKVTSLTPLLRSSSRDLPMIWGFCLSHSEGRTGRHCWVAENTKEGLGACKLKSSDHKPLYKSYKSSSSLGPHFLEFLHSLSLPAFHFAYPWFRPAVVIHLISLVAFSQLIGTVKCFHGTIPGNPGSHPWSYYAIICEYKPEPGMHQLVHICPAREEDWVFCFATD